MTSDFRDGDVVKYKPSSNWCHHGIAIVHIEGGKTYALDTYWGNSPTDNSYVAIAELNPANIIGNTHEFGPVPYPHDFYDFKESDRYYIPMGGSSEYQRVRKDAVADPELWEIRLRTEVEDAAQKIESARNTHAWKIREYEKHMGKPFGAASPESEGGAEQRKRAVEMMAKLMEHTPDYVEDMAEFESKTSALNAGLIGWEREIVADGLLREASGLEMSEELYQRIRSFLSAEA